MLLKITLYRSWCVEQSSRLLLLQLCFPTNLPNVELNILSRAPLFASSTLSVLVQWIKALIETDEICWEIPRTLCARTLIIDPIDYSFFYANNRAWQQQRWKFHYRLNQGRATWCEHGSEEPPPCGTNSFPETHSSFWLLPASVIIHLILFRCKVFPSINWTRAFSRKKLLFLLFKVCSTAFDNFAQF